MEERLKRLEARCRWLAAGLIGLVALVVGGGLVAMAAPGDGAVDEVRARRFVLVDRDGVERATLDTRLGGPGLVLYDANRAPRVQIKADQVETRANLLNPEGLGGIEIVASDRSTLASLLSLNGAELISAAATDEDAGLIINGGGVEGRVMLAVQDGEAVMRVRDAQGGEAWRAP